MIIGLTNNADGSVKIRRSVTTKLAIGLPPDAERNYPVRLDHFVFLKKGQRGSGKDARMEWEVDNEKMEAYGKTPREVWIVLLDDDPEQVFRTEYAAYRKTGRWCFGNGENARRRSGADCRGEFAAHSPCANHGCKEFESEKSECKPSGDLYFILADNPVLGSICRLHTSSYQSIGEIHTALQDLRRVTGGRLMGLRVKLTVRPEKNAYVDGKGNTVTGTKWVLGLELAAKDMAQLAGSLVETARLMDGIKKQLGTGSIEIDDDEDQRGPEIANEFYAATTPTSDGAKVDSSGEFNQSEPAEMPTIRQLFGKLGWNEAKQAMALGQYEGRLPMLISALQKRLAEAEAAKPTAREAKTTAETKQPAAETKTSKNEPGTQKGFGF